MKRYKILLIHNYYQQRGGEDIYFDSLVELLRQKNHEVEIYTNSSNSINSLSNKIATSVNLICNNKDNKELEYKIKIFSPDLAYFHNIIPLITPSAYFVCKNYQLPIIQRIPNFRYICPKGIMFRNGKICTLCIRKKFKYSSIMFFCYHNSLLGSTTYSLYDYLTQPIIYNTIDRFIFQTEFVRDIIIKHTPVFLPQTEIIKHFVPTTYIFSNNKNKKYFIYVGRLSEEKGILNLLKIFSELINIHLIVVGDGPFKRQVLDYSKYENITYKEYLPRRKVLNLMQNAIATIIPSLWYETGPFVLMESYSVGTPVIVPNHGVFPEQVTNGKTGIIYDHDQIETLKDSIEFASLHIKRMSRMGENSYREYLRLYTPEIHYHRLQKIFTSVIKLYENKQ